MTPRLSLMIFLNVRTNLRKSLSLGPHENPNLHPKLPDIALKRDAPFRGGFVESDTATVFLPLSAWFCASAYKFAVRIDDTLYGQARAQAKAKHLTIAGQIEF
ncbi:MAG: hypothetical protein WCG61_06345 [Chlorobium sp.]